MNVSHIFMHEPHIYDVFMGVQMKMKQSQTRTLYLTILFIIQCGCK